MTAASYTDAMMLAAVRVAWQTLCDAEATIARLETYKHPNARMKSDLFEAHARRHDARANLSRLLRAPTLSPDREAESLTGVNSQPRPGGSFNPPRVNTGD